MFLVVIAPQGFLQRGEGITQVGEQFGSRVGRARSVFVAASGWRSAIEFGGEREIRARNLDRLTPILSNSAYVKIRVPREWLRERMANKHVCHRRSTLSCAQQSPSSSFILRFRSRSCDTVETRESKSCLQRSDPRAMRKLQVPTTTRRRSKAPKCATNGEM